MTADRTPSKHEDLLQLQQDWRELIIGELNRVRIEIEKVQAAIREVHDASHQMEIDIVSLGITAIRKDLDSVIQKVASLETFRTTATTAGKISWALIGVLLTILGWLLGRK